MSLHIPRPAAAAAAAALAAVVLAAVWLTVTPQNAVAQTSAVVTPGTTVVREGSTANISFTIALNIPASSPGWRGWLTPGCAPPDALTGHSPASASDWVAARRSVYIGTGQTTRTGVDYPVTAVRDGIVDEGAEWMYVCLTNTAGTHLGAAQVKIVEAECHPHQTRGGNGCVPRSNVTFSPAHGARLAEGSTWSFTIHPIYPLNESRYECVWGGTATYGVDYRVNSCGYVTSIKIISDNELELNEIITLRVTLRKTSGDPGYATLNAPRLTISDNYRESDSAKCDALTTGVIGEELTVGLSFTEDSSSGGWTVPKPRRGDYKPDNYNFRGYTWDYQREKFVTKPFRYFRNPDAETPAKTDYKWPKDKDNSAKLAKPRNRDLVTKEGEKNRLRKYSNREYVWVRDGPRDYPGGGGNPIWGRNSLERYYYGQGPSSFYPRNSPRLSGARFFTNYSRNIAIKTYRSGGNTIRDEEKWSPYMVWTPHLGGRFSFEESNDGVTWNFCEVHVRDTLLTLTPQRVGEGDGATEVAVGVRLLESRGYLPRTDTTVFFTLGPGSATAADYTLTYQGVTSHTVSGSIIVPAGQQTGEETVILTPVDDDLYAPDERLSFRFSAPGRLPYTESSLTIVDDDIRPRIVSVTTSGDFNRAADPATSAVTFTAEVEGSGWERNPDKPLDVRIGHNPADVPRLSDDADDVAKVGDRNYGIVYAACNGTIFNTTGYTTLTGWDIAYTPVAEEGRIPCPRYRRAALRGVVAEDAGSVDIVMTARVKRGHSAECGKRVVFRAWLDGEARSVKTEMLVKDTRCAEAWLETVPTLYERRTVSVTIKTKGYVAFNVAYNTRVKPNSRWRNGPPSGVYPRWWNDYIGITPAFHCGSGDRRFTIRLGNDSYRQGPGRYLGLTIVPLKRGQSCYGGQFPVISDGVINRGKLYLGMLPVVDNDQPYAIRNNHTLPENGDSRYDAQRHYVYIGYTGTGLNYWETPHSTKWVRNPPASHSPSVNEDLSTGRNRIWRIHSFRRDALYVDVYGDNDPGDNKIVIDLPVRPAAGFREQNLRTLITGTAPVDGGHKQRITITIEDDDGGWSAWGASCSRHFGDGLAATWTSPSYAPTEAEHNLYQLAATAWKTPALWSGTVTDADGGGWTAARTYNDGATRAASVVATATHLDLNVTPQPAGPLVLRLTTAGGKVLTAATADAAARPGGGWRWAISDLFPAAEGSPFEAGDTWTIGLFEGGGPGGMSPTVSGVGSSATVSLAGSPSGQGTWRMSVRPYDAGGPLVQPGGAAVEMICSHNVELPVWVPGETGEGCEYFAVAVENGTRIHPFSAPPSYNHIPSGYAPYPRSIRWSPDPRSLGPNPPTGTARWGMTASSAGWTGTATRQMSVHHIWRLETADGTVLQGRDGEGRQQPIQTPCVLRIGAPALTSACSALAGTGTVLSHRALGYETYAGGWVAEDVWTPVTPPGVRLTRSGNVLLLAGSTADPGRWVLRLRLTDPEGVALVSRSQDGTWAPVTTICDLRAVDLNGAVPPGGAIRPAVKIGPSCAVPGDSWEVRLRKQGEAGTPQTIWDDFVTPAVTDPARLIFWYPYPATLRGDWLAPWEKPLPPTGHSFYPPKPEGEFNDPYQDSSNSDWTASRYSRLMTEAWDTYFPEYPLTP